jgi:hypothetical protein
VADYLFKLLKINGGSGHLALIEHLFDLGDSEMLALSVEHVL